MPSPALYRAKSVSCSRSGSPVPVSGTVSGRSLLQRPLSMYGNVTPIVAPLPMPISSLVTNSISAPKSSFNAQTLPVVRRSSISVPPSPMSERFKSSTKSNFISNKSPSQFGNGNNSTNNGEQGLLPILLYIRNFNEYRRHRPVIFFILTGSGGGGGKRGRNFYDFVLLKIYLQILINFFLNLFSPRLKHDSQLVEQHELRHEKFECEKWKSNSVKWKKPAIVTMNCSTQTIPILWQTVLHPFPAMMSQIVHHSTVDQELPQHSSAPER